MKLAILITPRAKGYDSLINLLNPTEVKIYNVDKFEDITNQSFYIKENNFDYIAFLDTTLYIRKNIFYVPPKYNEVVSVRNIVNYHMFQTLPLLFFIADSLTFHKLALFPIFEKQNYFDDVFVQTHFHYDKDRRKMFYFYAKRLGILKIENKGFVIKR